MRWDDIIAFLEQFSFYPMGFALHRLCRARRRSSCSAIAPPNMQQCFMSTYTVAQYNRSWKQLTAVYSVQYGTSSQSRRICVCSHCSFSSRPTVYALLLKSKKCGQTFVQLVCFESLQQMELNLLLLQFSIIIY